jgi:hypothetical protein
MKTNYTEIKDDDKCNSIEYETIPQVKTNKKVFKICQ